MLGLLRLSLTDHHIAAVAAQGLLEHTSAYVSPPLSVVQLKCGGGWNGIRIGRRTLVPVSAENKIKI